MEKNNGSANNAEHASTAMVYPSTLSLYVGHDACSVDVSLTEQPLHQRHRTSSTTSACTDTTSASLCNASAATNGGNISMMMTTGTGTGTTATTTMTSTSAQVNSVNNVALSPPRQLIRNLEDKLLHYGVLDMTWVIMSIFTYTFDQTMDILVAIYFFKNEHYDYFVMTTTFIVVPALTMTGFSLAWYIHDYKQGLRPPASKIQWTFRAISLFLHFGPILRYIESMVYGCKSRCGKQQKQSFFFMMIYEDTDAGLLRLFESFMEAAPQLVLQICILVNSYMPDSKKRSDNPPFQQEWLQVGSIVSSLVSLAWALASYNRSLRFSLDNKYGMTWPGTIVQFFWYLFNVASRVLALALFASIEPILIFVVCFVHWTAMTVWIYCQKTEFCTREWQEFLFDIVMGVIYIFCFFNVKDEPTRHKYVIYYAVAFCEGALLIAFWFVQTNLPLRYNQFRYLAFASYFALFAISIAVMVFYYGWCHPSLRGSHRPSSSSASFGDKIRANGLGVGGVLRRTRSVDESHGGMAAATSVADVGVQTTTDGGVVIVGPRMRSMRFYPAVPDKCPRRYSSKKIGRINETDLEHPLNVSSTCTAPLPHGGTGSYLAVNKVTCHETMA